METTVTLGQMIGSIIGAVVIVSGTGLVFWKNTDVKLAKMEAEYKALKDSHDELKSHREKDISMINEKFDKVMDGINKIQITLEKKADKEHFRH